MRKDKIKKIRIILAIFLVSNSFLLGSICEAKMRGSLASVEFILENKPEIGEFAVFRLSVTAPVNLDLERANIDCFLPQELELLDEKNYTIDFERYGNFWRKRVIFYSGSMKRGEKKEFIFKVRIPDGKRYLISAGINEIIELDLGDPEPPEWHLPSTAAGFREGKRYISSGVKQARDNQLVELDIPEDALPPLRTELRIRTKDKPDLIEYEDNPKGPVPFRHLVYVEKESPQVEVSCILPQGFEIVPDGPEYKTSADPEGNTRVLLYSGAMRFKECKAFYFKVRVAKPLDIERGQAITKTIHVETKLLTQENEILTKTDSRSIDFGRILY